MYIWTVWKLQAWPISAWSVHLPPINVSPDKLLVTVHNLHFTMKAVLLLSVLASAFAAPDTRLYINYNLLSALESPTSPILCLNICRDLHHHSQLIETPFSCFFWGDRPKFGCFCKFQSFFPKVVKSKCEASLLAFS